MKRIFVAICLSLFLGSFVSDFTASADVTAKINKEREKKYKSLYKDKIKALKNEGWQIDGDSRTLDVALLDHYTKLMEDGKSEIVGETAKSRSGSIGKQRCIWDAQTKQASLMSGEISGRVGSIIEADDESESEKFVEAFQKNIKADVSKLLQPSFTIKKVNGSGYTYQMFFIVDKDAAASVRKHALEESLKTAQLSKEVMNKISEFINEAPTE